MASKWNESGMGIRSPFRTINDHDTYPAASGLFTLCVHDRVGYERNCKWACIVRSAGPVFAWLGEVGLHWVSEMISSDSTVLESVMYFHVLVSRRLKIQRLSSPDVYVVFPYHVPQYLVRTQYRTKEILFRTYAYIT